MNGIQQKGGIPFSFTHKLQQTLRGAWFKDHILKIVSLQAFFHRGKDLLNRP